MDADADGTMRVENAARAAVLALATGFARPGHADPARADPTHADAAVAALAAGAETDTGRLIEILSARLLSAHSATAVLEAWCAERDLARDPRLTALRVPGPDKPLTPAQRERLGIGPTEAVRYRRVRLTCGGHVLSEADNWYVPARLTPEMNATLDATQAPFGRVVHPLAPTRRNLSMRLLWNPAEAAIPGPERPLFAVEAVLSTGAGLPFCEVAETYTGAVLLHGAR